ncbi:MAG: hypothetical protein JEY71_15195 [Sphaerochaeta sp.]|nr:hypothetical protein [Sphaerochaeta sp.]
MKGINTPGLALERGGVASFPEPRGSRISPCFPGTRSGINSLEIHIIIIYFHIMIFLDISLLR